VSCYGKGGGTRNRFIDTGRVRTDAGNKKKGCVVQQTEEGACVKIKLTGGGTGEK